MSAIIACSACNHRFEGGGYRDEQCPSCGALALRDRRCPRCTTMLVARRVSDVVIDQCNHCHGLYLDHAAIELLYQQHERVTQVMAALSARQVPPWGMKLVDPATCPSCGIAMQKNLSPEGAAIIIDVCKPHGVFFDAGELAKLLAFVQREQRERAAREHEDTRHAAQRTREERASLGKLQRAFDGLDALIGLFLGRD